MKKKREKAEARRRKIEAAKAGRTNDEDVKKNERRDSTDGENEVEIEYVMDDGFAEKLKSAFGEAAVATMFERFKRPEELLNDEVETEEEQDTKKENRAIADASTDGEIVQGEKKLSKRQKKLMSRLSVAQLKRLVRRPDVVESHDVTAPDPLLLVYLKAYPNSVPVPRHWCQKRKYLQAKRGTEKVPYKLPEFIEATGISKMRETVHENDDNKSLRQKARERMNAKMGKIDIDYEVLYTAFFKNQTKPILTGHGDLYYENKEYETKAYKKRPGVLTERLRDALGMQSEDSPPPWLINMQRYGPPPSYPSLKIPGLNAPIPSGASFGFHPGGWGKPPVDEFGQPLYGDVFRTSSDLSMSDDVVDKTRWGELEEIESEEEEDDFDGANNDEDDEVDVVDDDEGLATPSGISSVAMTGIETPGHEIDLRKGVQSVSSVDTPSQPRTLYSVLQSKDTTVSSTSLYGSDRQYVLPSETKKRPRNVIGKVDVALDPSELNNLNQKQLKAKYDEERLKQGGVDVPRRKKSRFGPSK